MSARKPAVLHRAGEGEMITDRTARTVRMMAGLKNLAMSWSRYSPGEEGPAPHVHKEHDDAWYVLAGELTFQLGYEDDATDVRVGPGDFVLAPTFVPHAFRNDSPEDVLFLNIHAPGCGFDEYMRALRDGRRRAAQRFDQHLLPLGPDGEPLRPAADAIVRRAGEGERVVLGPATGTIKAGGGDGGGSFALVELEVQPGFAGPLPHRHKELIDGFWVLDGELDVLVGDEWQRAGAGDYACVPPGNVHTFANRGEAPVRALDIIAPGGFEQYLIEVAATLEPGAPPDPAAMAEVAARYDFEVVDEAETPAAEDT